MGQHAETGRDAILGPALIAAAVAMVVALAVRVLLGLPLAAEVFGDRLTQRIPLPVFVHLLAFFGGNTKHVYFGGLVVAEGIAMALAGVAFYTLRRRLVASRAISDAMGVGREMEIPSLVEVALLVAWLWLLSAGIFAPVIGGGFFGSQLIGGAGGALTSQVLPDTLFAALLVYQLRREGAAAKLFAPAAAVASAAALTGGAVGVAQFPRRRLLKQSAVAVAVLAGGAVAVKLLASSFGPLLGFGSATGPRPELHLAPAPTKIIPPPEPVYGPWATVDGSTSEVTSAANFYYVSKDLVGDPAINTTSWNLPISGLVERPYALSYGELTGLPATSAYRTLECISNDVGGPLMSSASFTGTRLADLLNRAGIRPGASYVIFTGADGYSDALHLSQALNPDSLLVYHLNGEPLPRPHGYPARLLIPGLYGMKNGKWLTSLEVSAGPYTGYWEQQGWTETAIVKTMSRIDVPHDGDLLLAHPLFIAGVAFAGDRGIARVDVSTDAGVTWQTAILRRPLSALTWVLWELPWMPTRGTHVITVRAIDREGNVQTPASAPTLPDGASGYDAITVTVR